jgi:hypothetical protein
MAPAMLPGDDESGFTFLSINHLRGRRDERAERAAGHERGVAGPGRIGMPRRPAPPQVTISSSSSLLCWLAVLLFRLQRRPAGRERRAGIESSIGGFVTD